MNEGKYSFDRKAHTRASTPEELAPNPYTERSGSKYGRDSFRGPIAVGAIWAVVVAALAFNRHTSEENQPQVPPQQIETVTPEEQ